MTNPSTLIFLGLAVVWAIVLLPEGLKRLAKMRRSDSIHSFNRQLAVMNRPGASGRSGIAGAASLGRSHTGGPAVQRPARGRSNVINLRERSQSVAAASVRVPADVRRRRQEVTATLAAAALLSLLCVVAFGSAFLVVHLVADALLVGYLYLVSQANRNAASRATNGYRPVGYNTAGPRATGVPVTRIRPVDVVGASGGVRVARSSV